MEDRFLRIDAVLEKASANGCGWSLVGDDLVRTSDGHCPIESASGTGFDTARDLPPRLTGLPWFESSVVIIAADHSLAELRRRAEQRDHREQYNFAIAVRERMLQRFGLQESAS